MHKEFRAMLYYFKILYISFLLQVFILENLIMKYHNYEALKYLLN